ncbi:MAG: NERD domain-containing protein [Bacteroidetes bacterium]|nr:NERD domain-containing protein [Bacteroidota bacterium]
MWLFIVIICSICFILIFVEIRDRKLLETVTKANRGTRSERQLVLKILKGGIHAQTIFHDLYVKKQDGNFCQIDLVVATKVGIIVIEVKDYSGWIFGAGYQSQWTQVLAYGKRKYKFYNPIMQNNKHIVDLRKQLNQFATIPFYSIVVFYGDCVLKEINYIPNGTFLIKSDRVLEVIRTIMSNNTPAQFANKSEVVMKLKEAVKNGEDVNTRIQHIENIKSMLGKDRIFD